MIDYKPGEMYNKGWNDRKVGRSMNPGVSCPDPLTKEYETGYKDCHNWIIEEERKMHKSPSQLDGHPFYKEAHERASGQVFLSD